MTISEQKKDTIKLTAVTSLSGYAGRILSIPASIINAKFLGPSLLGVLAVINLIVQYAGYSHMGLMQSLPRDVPIAYGRGDKEEAKLITDTVYTGFFSASFLAVLVLWVLYFCGVRFKGIMNLTLLLLVSGIIICNRLNSFLKSYYKAEGEFMIIAKQEFIIKFIYPCLGIPAVILFRLAGVLFVMLFREAFSAAYYLYHLKRKWFRYCIDIRKTLFLLKNGFMIFINKISENIFWSVDLMIIAAMMTVKDVGLYSIALAAMNTVLPFSQGINMTVYRQIMVDGGKHGKKPGEHYRKYTEGYFILYMMLNSLILGLALICFMLIIRTILTQYLESLPIMLILGFGYMVFTSRIFLSFYMNVTDQLNKRLVIIMTGLGINALLDYILISRGYGIRGAAFACSLSFIFISALIMIISLRQIYESLKIALFYLAKICVVSAFLVGVLFLFYNWNLFQYEHLPTMYGKLIWGMADLVSKALLFSFMCVSGYILLFKKYKLIDTLKPMVSYVWSGMGGWMKLKSGRILGNRA